MTLHRAGQEKQRKSAAPEETGAAGEERADSEPSPEQHHSNLADWGQEKSRKRLNSRLVVVICFFDPLYEKQPFESRPYVLFKGASEEKTPIIPLNYTEFGADSSGESLNHHFSVAILISAKCISSRYEL
jgi:hypothetical protein